MHAWEGHAFDDIAPLTLKRDPRRYPVGCLTGNTTRCCLQWFRTVAELAQYLLRMEPQRWGVRGGELIDYKTRLQPLLTEVDVLGLQEPLRKGLNELTEPLYRIDWWGSFESFRHNPQHWPTRLRETADARTAAETLVERIRFVAARSD